MPYLLTRNRSKQFCARVQIPDSAAIIGRSRRAVIQLADRSVSKIHASIEPIPGTGRFLIRDLGSRNGIRVGGTQVEEVTLGFGDEFRLGQVRITICGEAPATLNLFEVEAAAKRHETVDLRAPLWRSILDRSERPLFIILALCFGGVLAGTLFFLWERLAASPGPEDGPTPPVAEGEMAPPPISVTVGDPSDEVLARREPEPVGEDSWVALAQNLDRDCSDGACHATSPRVDFRRGANAEYGRWERNLLVVRTAALQVGSAGWTLGRFRERGAHSRAMPLRLTSAAEKGARQLLAGQGRLLAPDAETMPLASLEDVEGSRVQELRRVWLLLYERWPTAAEIIANHRRTVAELVANAPRSEGDRGVGDPDEANRGEADGERHPRPEEDGSELETWIARSLRTPSAIPPDAYLRGIWCVLWGRAPDREEERLLLDTLNAGIDWGTLRPRMVALLVHSPRCPFPRPAPHSEEAWVSAVTKLTLGRELDPAVVTEIGGQLRVGALHPLTFLEECLLANE